MEKLLYLASNAGSIPTGRVSSTARKGSKWFYKLKVGDVVETVATETGSPVGLGHAVVVQKELTNYDTVIENADHNHVGNGRKLAEQLTAAYGKANYYDTYSIIHLLPINIDSYFTGILDKAEAVTVAAEAVQVNAAADVASANRRTGNALYRAQVAEYTSKLLMDSVAQMQSDSAKRITLIQNEINGIVGGAETAFEATGTVPLAIECTTQAGELAVTTRVEFAEADYVAGDE